MAKKKTKLSKIAKKSRVEASADERLHAKNSPEAIAGSERILRETLASEENFIGRNVRFIFFIMPGAAFFVGSAYYQPLRDAVSESEFIWVLCFLLSLGLGFIPSFFIKKLQTKMNYNRVRKMKYLSNSDEYLHQLSQARRSEDMSIYVTFEKSWSTENKKDAKDALTSIYEDEKDEEVKITWKDHKNMRLKTRHSGTTYDSGGSGFAGDVSDADVGGSDHTYFSNQSYHKNLLFFYREILPLLEEVQPIEKIRVEIEGDVLNPEVSAERDL